MAVTLGHIREMFHLKTHTGEMQPMQCNYSPAPAASQIWEFEPHTGNVKLADKQEYCNFLCLQYITHTCTQNITGDAKRNLKSTDEKFTSKN